MSRAAAIAALSIAAVVVAVLVFQTWFIYALGVIAVVAIAALWIYLTAKSQAAAEPDDAINEPDNAPTGVRPSSQS